MGAVVQTQNNNPADVEEHKEAAFGLPLPVLKWYVYRTNTHITMLNSISYLEISCKYNKVDLKLFTGACSHKGSSRVVVYRNRRYFFSFDADDDAFYLVNKYGVCIGMLVGDIFKFYVSHAREVGLENVWGLLAKINVYPVTSL